jgi:hypothetical protein
MLATMALAGFASSASATVTVAGGTFTATTTGLQTLSTGFVTLTCLQSLTLSVPSAAYAGATLPVGRVTAASFICNNGDTAVALNLPWQIGWNGTLLTLPDGTTGVALTVLSAQIQATHTGVACLYTGNIPIGVRSDGVATTTGFLLGGTMSFTSGGFFCGTGAATVSRATYRLDHAITVTLS